MTEVIDGIDGVELKCQRRYTVDDRREVVIHGYSQLLESIFPLIFNVFLFILEEAGILIHCVT